MSELPGYAAMNLGNDMRFLVVHYSADPDKDMDWANKTKTNIPIDEWNREMELFENVYEGEAIFRDYVDDFHCPKPIRKAYLPIVPGSEYIMGHDVGQTLQPAGVLFQITPPPIQIHALLEVIAPGWPMEKYAPLVMQRLMTWHPGLWSQVKHVGDSTMTTKSGSRGETAQDVARKQGLVMTPVSNQWHGRYSAVTWALMNKINEQTPGLLISGLGCPVLRKSFQGAYQWQKSSTADQSGPGVVLKQPLKNAFSHVNDAAQYALFQIRKEYGGRKTQGQVGSRR